MTAEQRRPPTALDPVELLPPLPKDYTYDEAVAELLELYADMPDVLCKGLCHDSCTAVGATELERQLIAKAGGDIGPAITYRRLKQLISEDRKPRCPSLGPLNNCTVHEQRPFICRLFGVAQDLRCEHGCAPDKLVPAGEGHRVMALIEQLSRHVTGVRAWPVERETSIDGGRRVNDELASSLGQLAAEVAAHRDGKPVPTPRQVRRRGQVKRKRKR